MSLGGVSSEGVSLRKVVGRATTLPQLRHPRLWLYCWVTVNITKQSKFSSESWYHE